MENNLVIIHCKIDYADDLFDIADKHTFDMFIQDEESHIIVDDVPYNPEDGKDPDVQLCDYYEIDYRQVNCIEKYEEPVYQIPESLQKLSKSEWGKKHLTFISA